MPTATVNGIELYYEVRGSGPRLLSISGTGGDLRQRPNVFDGQLVDHFEVLGYDQRGLGRSAKPDVEYTMADYADDAAALLDAVGWDRCFVMGVSFGGMVAQELALRHPDRVERLVLVCTSSGGAGGASYPLQELSELEDHERLRKSTALVDTRPEFAQNLIEFFTSYSAEVEPEPGSDIGARRQLEARAGHDTFDRLGKISCPTLVAAGRYDGIAPLENSERLAAAIPGAELQVFEGGHVFLYQDQTALPAIIKFLES